MKDIYIVASGTEEPREVEKIRDAFSTEDVELVFGEDGCLFSVRSNSRASMSAFTGAKRLWVGRGPSSRVWEGPSGRCPRPGGSIAWPSRRERPRRQLRVFEGLWVARMLLELLVEGVLLDVTAFKLHTLQDVEEMTGLDFDIRDHVAIHAQEPEGLEQALWVHTHGLSKFGIADVEMFYISEEDLPAAEVFLQELCTDLAFGQGPAPRVAVPTSVGNSFMLVPSEEGRTSLHGVVPETFEGHEGNSLVVVGPDGRHSMGQVLAQYRDHFEEESEDEKAELERRAMRLLPSFKARFLRRGLMEPLSFLVRAPFETHPDGDEEPPNEEQLWAEVVSWDNGRRRSGDWSTAGRRPRSGAGAPT